MTCAATYNVFAGTLNLARSICAVTTSEVATL